MSFWCSMSYEGPPVRCRSCGQSFTRPESLVRHLDGRRCLGRIVKASRSRPARLPGQVAIVPAKPRLPIRAEVLDVTPVRAEIVPVTAGTAPARPILARSEPEPDWFAREFPQEVAKLPWRKRDEENRDYFRSQHAAWARAAVEHSKSSLPRRPDEADLVTLWEQYHFLKAVAVRLDAGRGTEWDREMFDAGLREYNANYDRIGAQSKALPG